MGSKIQEKIRFHSNSKLNLFKFSMAKSRSKTH